MKKPVLPATLSDEDAKDYLLLYRNLTKEILEHFSSDTSMAIARRATLQTKLPKVISTLLKGKSLTYSLSVAGVSSGVWSGWREHVGRREKTGNSLIILVEETKNLVRGGKIETAASAAAKQGNVQALTAIAEYTDKRDRELTENKKEVVVKKKERDKNYVLHIDTINLLQSSVPETLYTLPADDYEVQE